FVPRDRRRRSRRGRFRRVECSPAPSAADRPSERRTPATPPPAAGTCSEFLVLPETIRQTSAHRSRPGTWGFSAGQKPARGRIPPDVDRYVGMISDGPRPDNDGASLAWLSRVPPLEFPKISGGITSSPDRTRTPMAEKITPRATDYSQWYLDVVKEAGLAENS